MNGFTTHLTTTPALVAIHERHAIRSFTDEPVKDGDIDLLLDAAVAAPSAMNSQPWAFVVLTGAGLLAGYERQAIDLLRAKPPPGDLASMAAHDRTSLRDLLASADLSIFHGAPAVIVIYATSAAGIPDCFLAAENILLAACALELGTCPIGLAVPLFNQAWIKAELEVPDEYVTALPIAVGVAAATGRPPSHEPARVLARR